MTDRRRSAWLVAVLLVLSLVAAACGGDDDDTSADRPDQGDNSGRVTDEGGTPVPGGSLVFGQESDVATLDVAKNLAQPADRNISLAVYDTLMAYNDDGDLEPFLAESIEAADDLTSYTIKVRSGVVFHDDTPLNADAVIAHFDRLKDPATASTWKTDADAIASMEKVDDLTVKFTMTGPNVGFPDVLAGTVGLIESPTAVQKEGADFGQRPVGTGPFKLTEFIPGDRVVVEKNPKYWRKDANGTQLPYLDRIVFRPIPDTKQRINALRAGDVDMIQTADASTIKQGEDAGMEVQRISGSSSTVLLFNHQRPPVDDVKVRRALAAAIDKEAINDVVWDGTREVANSAFSPDSGYFIKTPEAPTYDPEEAEKLLAEYGKPVSVTLECINTPESQQLLQLVEQMWEAVGVDVRLIFTEQGQFVNKIFGTKDYVTACFRSNQFADPDQLYTTYKTGSPANVLNYSNPEMDAALEEGRATADIDERKKAYAKVQRISAETVPAVTFAYDLFSNIYKPTVHGLPVPEAKSLGAIKTATIWIEK